MSEKELRALIVDDDLSWQNLIGEILTDLDFEVDFAADLVEAENILRDSSHRLAIVDLSLDINNHRNTDGLEMLHKIEQYDPGCTPLLLSGYATVELAVKAIKEYKAYTCLQKEDFSRIKFKQIVQEILSNTQINHINIYPTGEEELADEQQSDAGVSSSTDKNALIVEDDAGWRNLLLELMVEAGYDVQASASFGEALGFLGRNKYHMAVVDLTLNRERDSGNRKTDQGFRLLENCDVKGITTIVVSGLDSPEKIQQIYDKYQIFTFIEKQTFEREVFLRTVKLAEESKQLSGELEELTERELQVLNLLTQGLTNKQIAKKLIVSPNTIKRHIKAIFEKLDVHTRSAATAKAISAFGDFEK